MNHNDLAARVAEISAELGGTVSVAVRNIDHAIDFAANADVSMSTASVIKIPILVTALQQVRDGKLSLDSEYVLPDGDRTTGAGVLRYLHSGLTLTLSDVLTLMIIVSDNLGTNVVIDMLGMDLVNATMHEMGLPGTLLQRTMMDWAAVERGEDNISTAGEITELLVRLATNQVLGEPWDPMAMQMLRRQQDCGKLGLYLPHEAVLANKTGGREGIMHDCGVVEGPGFKYAITVFTHEAKSSGDAIVAIGSISRAVYEHVAGLSHP